MTICKMAHNNMALPLLLIEYQGDELSPFGRTGFTPSASLQSLRGKASTASGPDALQLKQNRFVKSPGKGCVHGY